MGTRVTGAALGRISSLQMLSPLCRYKVYRKMSCRVLRFFYRKNLKVMHYNPHPNWFRCGFPVAVYVNFIENISTNHQITKVFFDLHNFSHDSVDPLCAFNTCASLFETHQCLGQHRTMDLPPIPSRDRFYVYR